MKTKKKAQLEKEYTNYKKILALDKVITKLGTGMFRAFGGILCFLGIAGMMWGFQYIQDSTAIRGETLTFQNTTSTLGEGFRYAMQNTHAYAKHTTTTFYVWQAVMGAYSMIGGFFMLLTGIQLLWVEPKFEKDKNTITAYYKEKKE